MYEGNAELFLVTFCGKQVLTSRAVADMLGCAYRDENGVIHNAGCDGLMLGEAARLTSRPQWNK